VSALPRGGQVASIDPSEPVLARRPLREGVELADTARFGQDVWDLLPATLQRHAKKAQLYFTSTPEPFRSTVKELFFAELRGTVPAGTVVLDIMTIRTNFGNANEFLRWAVERGRGRLAEITERDLIDFRQHLLRQQVTDDTRGTKWRVVRRFWLLRPHILGDGLQFDPQVVVENNTGFGTLRRGENATDRIPAQVLAPLLAWALRWVEDFADDIVAGVAEWGVLAGQTQTNRRRAAAEPATGALDRLEELLEDYRREGRRLPVDPRRPGTVNVSHLAREVGCTPSSLNPSPLRAVRQRRLLSEAVADLGLAEDTYLRTPVNGLLDGRRWLPGLSYQDADLYVRLLRAAAYVVIAFLSGMRDSEIKHLRPGCVSTWCDSDGRPVRRKLESLAFKNEADPAGVPATWVVTEPVARAVAALEALLPASGTFLFGITPTGRNGQTAPDGAQQGKTTLEGLRHFMAWVNDYCAAHGRTDGIPLVKGEPWHLTTRQFRRTLAWFIAREPGGAIAGAIQYRHLGIQMFEGYAGTSDSGFRAEVQAEQAIARGEGLGDLVLSGQYRALTGPAAAEAEQRLAAFEQHAQFTGKVVTDRKRLQRIMTRHDPNIYPGRFVTCVHNPDRALCRRGEAAGPSLEDCKPFSCRNVALTEHNRAELAEHLTTIEQALAKEAVLAPYLRRRLELRLEEVTGFLGPHAAAQTTHRTEQDTAR
jgi:integrase